MSQPECLCAIRPNNSMICIHFFFARLYCVNRVSCVNLHGSAVIAGTLLHTYILVISKHFSSIGKYFNVNRFPIKSIEFNTLSMRSNYILHMSEHFSMKTIRDAEEMNK